MRLTAMLMIHFRSGRVARVTVTLIDRRVVIFDRAKLTELIGTSSTRLNATGAHETFTKVTIESVGLGFAAHQTAIATVLGLWHRKCRCLIVCRT
jgi:hypothetical protein